MAKASKLIHICPKCGNDKATQVTKKSYYCIKCDIEFDKDNKIFMIMCDGTLADYEVNEFADIY